MIKALIIASLHCIDDLSYAQRIVDIKRRGEKRRLAVYLDMTEEVPSCS